MSASPHSFILSRLRLADAVTLGQALRKTRAGAGWQTVAAQQTFVEPYGIRSLVGMGGLLPSGELFAVILFARVTVARDVATLFRTLALGVKLAFLPFAPDQVFTGISEFSA